MSEGALTVLQVILVMANVRRTVRPLRFTHAVLLTVLPLAIVRASVSVFAPTLPVHLVVTELSCVDDSDAGPVCARAVLSAMKELTFIPGTVGPVLDTAAPLFIPVPLALKGAAINLGVPPKAVHTVLVPLPVVRVAVCRQEHAVPVGPTVGEGALVCLAIRLLHKTVAMPLLALPLALVPRAALHFLLRPLLQLPVVGRCRQHGGAWITVTVRPRLPCHGFLEERRLRAH